MVDLLNSQNQSNQTNQPNKPLKKPLNVKKAEFKPTDSKPKSDSAPNSAKNSLSFGEKKFFPSSNVNDESKDNVNNPPSQINAQQNFYGQQQNQINFNYTQQPQGAGVSLQGQNYQNKQGNFFND